MTNGQSVDLFGAPTRQVQPPQPVQPALTQPPIQLKPAESSNKSGMSVQSNPRATHRTNNGNSASADLLDLDMSGQNTLTNILAMHNAKQHQQASPFGQAVSLLSLTVLKLLLVTV